MNRLFLLVYQNQDANSERFKTWTYYLPKGTINISNVKIYGKNFDYQAIDSDIKRYEEVRKLITGQGEDYTTGCLFSIRWISSYYVRKFGWNSNNRSYYSFS